MNDIRLLCYAWDAKYSDTHKLRYDLHHALYFSGTAGKNTLKRFRQTFLRLARANGWTVVNRGIN